MQRSLQRMRGAMLGIVIVAMAFTTPIARASEKASGMASVTADSYLAHIKYLADDKLEGRLPGEPGIALAAEYIVQRYKELGLEPAGDDCTFFQTFEVKRRKALDCDQARITITGVDKQAVCGTDFEPLAFSRPGDFAGPLAFAGYGISAPEYDYDDYAGLDATGKVLIVLRHEPKADDKDAAFGGDPPSTHALFSTKARIANEHGAVGLLVVNPVGEDAGDELYGWRDRDGRVTYDLPLVHITRAYADEILAAAHLPPIADLQAELDAERAPLSTDLVGITATIEPGISYTKTRNIIAKLPGSEAPDECIVVGAHYDHLGKRRPWGTRQSDPEEIHNGADDNASGTSGVLELAKAFATGPRPRRSIVFMNFSAEEMGLLGSKYWVAHPTFPIERIKAMYNLDMIGRYSQDQFALCGMPTGAEFTEMVDRITEAYDITYKALPNSNGLFRRSDHAPFFDHDIPVMFAFTGLHSDYHKPSDDWELIDSEGAVKVLHLMHDIAQESANMEAGPTFQPWSEEDEADDDAGDVVRVMPARPRVRLGVIPDMSDDKGGMLIDRVMPDGPASAAGIKPGDRIVKLGDGEIKDLQGYLEVAAKLNPGDSVTAVVKRGEEELTVTVEFPKSADDDAKPTEGDAKAAAPTNGDAKGG